MNNPIIFQAGGALAILAFLVFLFLCARTWRIWHVIFTFFVFASAIAFVILASMTLKTRYTWRTKYEQLTKELVNKEKELQELRDGELLVVRQTGDSVRSIRGKLQRVMLDRGRVWRDCVATNLNNGVLTLDTYRPQPGDPADAAADANNRMQPKTTVYGFMEMPPAAAGGEPWLLYMGEFSAESVTPTSVSLRALTPPDPVQVQAMSNANGTTWSLYEVVPPDDHRSFAMDPEYQPDLGEVGAPLYGEMQETMLDERFQRPQAMYRSYFQNLVQQAPPDRKAAAQAMLQWVEEGFQKSIEGYKKDGQVVSDPTNYADEDIWVKVQFLQEYTVDVDARANLGGINADGYFDAEGRAQVADLQRGERDEDGNFVPAEAEFEPDDVAVFHKGAADQLIADGIARQVDSAYVRPLRDFDYSFRTHIERMRDLQHDIRLAQRDIVTVTDANDKLQAQIDMRSAEKAKLEVDEQKVNDELKAITEYRQKLETVYADARRRLSLLYRANKQKAEQLRQIQQDHLSKVRAIRRAAELAGP